MKRSRVALLLVVLAGWALGPVEARRQTADVRLLTDLPFAAARQLQRAARDGFECVTVARPVVPLLPETVTVLLTKAATTPAADMTAVVARTPVIDDFEEAVVAMAGRGFRICGLTYTAPAVSRASLYTPVAVMTRIPAGTAPPDYRVVRTRGARTQWQQLDAAGAAGFAVAHVFSRPMSETSDESELVFVTEKTASSRPVRYELVFAGNAVDLEKSANRLAADGYQVQAAWSANTRVSLLMARPLSGAWPAPAAYTLDDPSPRRFSSLDGTLFAMLRHRDGFMAIYDRTAPRHEYTTTTGQFDDAPLETVLTDRRKSLFLERLDADYGRRYRPVDFTVERGRGAQLVATVTLARQP